MGLVSLSVCPVGSETQSRFWNGGFGPLISSVAVGAPGTEVKKGDMSFATVEFSSLLSLTSLSSPFSLSLFLSLSHPPTILWHRSAFSYSRSTLAPCRRRVPSDTGGETGSWARRECRGTQGAEGCLETEGQSEARIA